MDFYEFAAPTEESAIAFVAALKEKGYDVEEPFHARQGTDGRFGVQGFTGMQEAWTVSVYVQCEGISDEVRAQMDTIAMSLNVQDWGCEPSTSWEAGERDGSVNAHL